MRVLFDTCIILDSLLKREPFYLESDQLFLKVANEEISGYVTVKSLMDLHYFLKKNTNNEKKTREILSKLTEVLSVLDSSADDCVKSLASEINDYEDAMMSITGENADIKHFVTRNGKNYKKSKLHIYSPKELLTILDRE